MTTCVEAAPRGCSSTSRRLPQYRPLWSRGAEDRRLTRTTLQPQKNTKAEHDGGKCCESSWTGQLSARLHGNSLSLIAPIWQKECQPSEAEFLETAWALESDDDEVRFQAPDLEQSIYAADNGRGHSHNAPTGVTMQLLNLPSTPLFY